MMSHILYLVTNHVRELGLFPRACHIFLQQLTLYPYTTSNIHTYWFTIQCKRSRFWTEDWCSYSCLKCRQPQSLCCIVLLARRYTLTIACTHHHTYHPQPPPPIYPLPPYIHSCPHTLLASSHAAHVYLRRVHNTRKRIALCMGVVARLYARIDLSSSYDHVPPLIDMYTHTITPTCSHRHTLLPPYKQRVSTICQYPEH